MTEVERIMDQLKRAFEGPAWHGDSVFEILQGVTAKQAAAHPIPNAHSIWELCLHMKAWGYVVKQRIEGKQEDLPEEGDWPRVAETNDAAWNHLQADMKKMCHDIRHSVMDLDDMRLMDFAVGCDYDIYVMLHGLIQHCTYHSAQIALLKKFAA